MRLFVFEHVKNIPVDVLKLDMRFLDISETEEEKA